MAVISVKNFAKSFKAYKKEPGFLGSVKSLYSRKYEVVPAVKDISFNIEEGELVGFIGPNGAGKTTTLKCLSGLLYPTSGKVEVLGFNPWKRQEKFLKQISLVMGQKNQLWWDLPPIESFLLNKEIYGISDNKFKETLDELSELLEIEDILKVQVRKLSLGQRMKCELAAAILHTPQVLFLDEPTIGLDVLMQKKLRDFIKVYNKRYKSTIILTSHYMEDVRQLCERIIVIDHGEILYDGKLSEIVKKFSHEKFLKIVFEKEIKKEELARFGRVREYFATSATIEIKREKMAAAVSAILKKYSVDDITIEEPDIEEIIRDVFSKK